MRASTISVRNSARPALRVSTVLEGLSHALDLTEGHPRGHATRTALIGLRLGRALQLAPGLQAELLYALLLKDAGCSANASLVCDLFGGCDHEVKRAVWMRDWRRVPEQIAHAMAYIGRGSSLVARMRQFGKFAVRGAQGSGTEIFAVRCERGAQIARMVGLSETVVEAIRAMDEHWDGGGYPNKLRRLQTPVLARIIGLAQVVEIFWSQGGPDRAVDVARERRGRWFDPELVDAFVAAARDRGFWAGLSDARLDRDLLTLVPAGLEIPTDDALLDRIADAFALIIDAKSPYTFEHSARVADYALAINERPRRSRRRTGASPARRAPARHRQAHRPEHDSRQAGPPGPQRARRRRAAPGLHAVAPPARPGVQRVRRRRRQPPRVGERPGLQPRSAWRGAVGDGAHPRRRRRARRRHLGPAVPGPAMPIEGVEAILTTGAGTHFDEDCVAACMDGVVELAVASRQARRDSRVA